MRQSFAPIVYGRYGFSDSFQPLSRWVNPDVVGIDLGITLLSAENLGPARCGSGSAGSRIFVARWAVSSEESNSARAATPRYECGPFRSPNVKRSKT